MTGVDAPGVDGNVEFAADLEEELFDALFFRGFDGDDRMARVDEEAKFVAFIEFRRDRAYEAAPIGCARLHRSRTGLFDFTSSVP